MSQLFAAKYRMLAPGLRSLPTSCPSSKLKITKYVAPVYPSKALRQSVEGWVDLEFTLDVQGSIQDITVKNTVPTGVFEKTAVDAVSQWRYQPVTRNGAAIEQRSAIRVQFKLEK